MNRLEKKRVVPKDVYHGIVPSTKCIHTLSQSQLNRNAYVCGCWTLETRKCLVIKLAICLSVSAVCKKNFWRHVTEEREDERKKKQKQKAFKTDLWLTCTWFRASVLQDEFISSSPGSTTDKHSGYGVHHDQCTCLRKLNLWENV